MRRLSRVIAAGVALLGAPGAGLIAPASVAAADPAVVSATIYTGSQAGIVSQTVTVGALSNCPTYSGASPFLLDPSGIPYQPAPGSSWSLDTIVECGLRIPAASLTDVAVQSLQHGFEMPLSPPDLTDPSRYQDPTAPGALPVISLDGGQNQVTYARPERSPGDANAGDSVTDGGPVSIAVYETVPPLHVRASAHRLSASSTALTVRFAATVTDAAGHALAPTGLSWSWSFGDGAGSAVAASTHSFPLGGWFVTVTVTDHANGTGGTDTIPVTVDSPALTAPPRTDGARAPTARARRRRAPSPAPWPLMAGPRTRPPATGPVRRHRDPPRGASHDHRTTPQPRHLRPRLRRPRRHGHDRPARRPRRRRPLRTGATPSRGLGPPPSCAPVSPASPAQDHTGWVAPPAGSSVAC